MLKILFVPPKILEFLILDVLMVSSLPLAQTFLLRAGRESFARNKRLRQRKGKERIRESQMMKPL
jgi:hypothetical protein